MGNYLESVKKSQEKVKTNGCAAEDPYLQAKCPMLHTLLTQQEMEGKKIKTFSLVVFAEDGSFKCSLLDRQSRMVGFKALDTVEDLFEFLEAKLVAGEIDWRPMRNQSFR